MSPFTVTAVRLVWLALELGPAWVGPLLPRPEMSLPSGRYLEHPPQYIPPSPPFPLPREDAATRAVEKRWAKGVARDFFAVLRRGEPSAAVGLLTPEFRETVVKDRWGTWSVVGNHQSVTFLTEAVAPNGSEVVLTGILKGDTGDSRGPFRCAFTVRVTKEGKGGVWRIRSVLVDESVREGK